MLVLEELSVAYGESMVISDVELEVPPGQVVCLLGRNGVGKTTLLKTVMGLMRPRRGRVLLRGADVTGWAPHQRAQAGVGYVPQGRGIFPYLTVHENLLMGMEALPARERTAAALDEMYELFPALRRFQTKAAGTLSGGQQQQLALARTLVRRPALLLLDEPTEGIQPSIVQEIEELVLRLREQRDMAVLLVEQFVDFAVGVADAYYIMEKGAIVAHGPAAELDDDMVREYLAV